LKRWGREAERKKDKYRRVKSPLHHEGAGGLQCTTHSVAAAIIGEKCPGDTTTTHGLKVFGGTCFICLPKIFQSNERVTSRARARGLKESKTLVKQKRGRQISALTRQGET